MDGRPNRRNKAALSNFSGIVWTLPESGYLRRAIFIRLVTTVLLLSPKFYAKKIRHHGWKVRIFRNCHAGSVQLQSRSKKIWVCSRAGFPWIVHFIEMFNIYVVRREITEFEINTKTMSFSILYFIPFFQAKVNTFHNVDKAKLF